MVQSFNVVKSTTRKFTGIITHLALIPDNVKDKQQVVSIDFLTQESFIKCSSKM